MNDGLAERLLGGVGGSSRGTRSSCGSSPWQDMHGEEAAAVEVAAEAGYDAMHSRGIRGSMRGDNGFLLRSGSGPYNCN